MPQMKVDGRFCSEPRKNYDAPGSSYVTFEIKDDSSPDSSPPLNNFLQKGTQGKSDPSQETFKGSKNEDKTWSKNPDPSNGDLGLRPSKVVNGLCSNVDNSNANKSDNKISLFSDSLLSSLTCKPNKDGNNMKVVNGCDTQVMGDYSDLLSSISLPDHGLKENSNFDVCGGYSFDDELKPAVNCTDELNQCTTGNENLSSILSSISFTELDAHPQNSSVNSIKPKKPEFNNGGLSDILSSISFDNLDNSQQNTSLNNSSPKPHNSEDLDLKELISDFPLLNSNTLNNTSKSTAPKSEYNGSLSDMLSSIDFPENSKELNSIGQGSLSTKSTVADSMPSSFFIDTPRTTDPVNDEKNDFSFFSVSPDNVFSAVLSNLHANSNIQEKNIIENTDNISMLDLLKSVNTDSSGSLAGYLDMPHETKKIDTDKEPIPDDLRELLDIDLCSCIKTSENTDTYVPELPVNNIDIDDNITDVKFENTFKPVFEKDDSNRPRVNQSQSLFAKALSSKPKRNPELLRKASFVKIELYKLYFNCEFHDVAESDKNFRMQKDIHTNNEMVVFRTNDCMVSFKGRRVCPSEVN